MRFPASRTGSSSRSCRGRRSSRPTNWPGIRASSPPRSSGCTWVSATRSSAAASPTRRSSASRSSARRGRCSTPTTSNAGADRLGGVLPGRGAEDAGRRHRHPAHPGEHAGDRRRRPPGADHRVPVINYVPRRPEQPIDGRIVSIYSGLAETGTQSIVTLNRGARQGMQVGYVLALLDAGATIRDRTSDRRELITCGRAHRRHVRVPRVRRNLLCTGVRVTSRSGSATASPSRSSGGFGRAPRNGRRRAAVSFSSVPLAGRPPFAAADVRYSRRAPSRGPLRLRHGPCRTRRLAAADADAGDRPEHARMLLAAYGLPEAIFAAGRASLARHLPGPLASVLPRRRRRRWPPRCGRPSAGSNWIRRMRC